MKLQNILPTSAGWMIPASVALILVCWVPSLVGGQEDAVPPKVPVLKYQFETDQKIGYEFDAESTIDGTTTKSAGFVTFERKAANVTEDLEGDSLRQNDDGETTSTAFTVTPDGYLVTCAHCVEGAETVEVEFVGKKYSAEIIHSAPDLDLAVIKIEATDLPTVQLGDSKTVKLAQNVRAIGFPLSSLLGNSVKVVAGSVAGFVDSGGATNLQIDGAVNPGNSGGPLVNEQGHVVGVVNAKLNGESISKVGFAVPINYLKQTLESLSIEYSSADQAQTLTGPELAARVTPAVGLVEAKLGKDGFRTSRNFLLSASGTVTESKDADARPTREVVQAELIIDPYGNVVDIKSLVNLPMLMGPVASMPFETLPRRTRNQWTEVENLVLPLPDEMPRRSGSPLDRFDPLDPFDPGFGPRFHHPGYRLGFGHRFGMPERPKQTKTRTAVAIRTRKYQITGQKADRVLISQNETFRTLDDDEAFSNLRIQTESKLEFDLQRGLFVSKQLEGKIRFKLGSDNHTFPIKLNYRWVDLDNLFADSKPPAKLNLLADQVIGLTAEQWDRFLQLQEKLPEPELLEYLELLARWNNAPEFSTEVSEAIETIVRSENRKTFKPAIEALLNWNPTAATPLLIEELEQASAFSKRSWIVKLGRTEDERAAEVLGKYLIDAKHRTVAAAALKQLGPIAEPSVLLTLGQNLGDLRTAVACLDVLADIGTDKSQTAISKILEDQPDWASKSQAERSLKSIQRRVRK